MYFFEIHNFDDEKHADNSLVQIWKVNFGHKVKFLFGLWCKVSRFVQDFEFDVPARFWSCIADVVEEQIGEQWSHATWKPNAFTRMLDSETYVHATWKGGINNDDMKDTTNDI